MVQTDTLHAGRAIWRVLSDALIFVSGSFSFSSWDSIWDIPAWDGICIGRRILQSKLSQIDGHGQSTAGYACWTAVRYWSSMTNFTKTRGILFNPSVRIIFDSRIVNSDIAQRFFYSLSLSLPNTPKNRLLTIPSLWLVLYGGISLGECWGPKPI